MTRLRLILAHDPAALLEHAAEGFLSPPEAEPPDPFPSPDYLLALRQGGVRDDLLSLAARRGVPGWFDPPLCIFHELPEWLGSTERRPIGDYERLVLLSSALGRAAGEVFRRIQRPDAYLDALDRLFGELAAEGVSPDDYEAALDRAGGRDAFERRRDAELAAIYRLYRDDLDRAGCRDGRDTYVDVAEAVSRNPGELRRRLGGRREIRVFGLQDLRGGWRALLTALRDSAELDRVLVYTSPGAGLESELDAEVERLQETATLPAWLFEPDDAPGSAERSSGAGAAGRPVRAIAAPDPVRELEEVARRIRGQAEIGVPLNRIAVVPRSARPYVEHAVAALERFGVPASARRRIGFREIPVVRSILALFQVAAERWTRHGLAELAEQPYLGSELDAHVLNHIGFRRRVEGLAAWTAALDELVAEAAARERRQEAGEDDEAERRAKVPPAWRVERARAGFASFRERAKELDATRTLDGWVAWLTDLLERDPWGIGSRIWAIAERPIEPAPESTPAEKAGAEPVDPGVRLGQGSTADEPASRSAPPLSPLHARAIRADLAGLRALVRVLDEWRAALGRWGGGGDRLDAAGFAARLRELLDGDVAFRTETDGGVQVLEAHAAAYRAFDHVFLVGLEAGRFPVHAPASPLMDEGEREALAAAGLPLERRGEWDRRERELFRVLLAGAGELTMSWARLDDGGRETVRSAFVEAVADHVPLDDATEEIPSSRVLTPGLPLYRDRALGRHALRVARIERERQAGTPSPHNGRIEDPELVAWLDQQFGDDRVWSPSQLEAYAKCPWAYFSGRLLQLEKLEDPDDDLDPSVRGTILHDALRRFYERARERAGGPVFLREADRGWAEPLLRAAADEAIDAAEAELWLGNPTLRDAKRDELRRTLTRYLDSEIDEHEAMFQPRNRNAPRILRTAVAEHELAFDDVVLEVDGVRFRFRGFIDRVETGVDERVDSAGFVAAVDYKTSKYAAPGGGHPSAWDDGVVLQVPLYAYALEQLRPGVAVSRVEYRALKQRQPVHSLQLYQVDPKRGELERDEAAVERMRSALAAVARHVRGARTGRFPASPAPSCLCPPFCHAWDICRTLGGPRKKVR